MIVIGLADLHVGSSMGLWVPGFPIQDGGAYELNGYQDWLWRCWQELEFRLLCLREENLGEEIVLVVDGDLIQGGHEKDGQLVTHRADIQALCLADLLKRLRPYIDRLYILHGTGWHGGPASCHITPVAEMLEAAPCPGSGGRIWWELYLDIDGHLTHWTHHVSATSLPFYEATAPTRDYYVLESELVRIYGGQAPDVELTVRAHRHRCIRVEKPPHVNVLVLPCWQLKGEFGFKVGSGSLPDIGYAIIRGGERLTVEPVIYQLPRVHIEGRGA
jgi:hypothetical protein